MHVVALTKLSCETPALLRDETAKKQLGDSVAAVVFLLSSPDMGQPAPHDDGSVETEIRSDTGFSVFNNSRKSVEDPFAEVEDPTRSFAHVLATLSASYPGQLGPIIQHSVAADPKLAVSLDTMLRNSGLSPFSLETTLFHL
jgi:CAS/CSE protein, C-terminus